MRILIVALAGTLLLLQARLWLTDGGLREVWRLRAEVERRTEENARLAARNAALAGEVQDLKQGVAAAEERARTELGMISPARRSIRSRRRRPPSARVASAPTPASLQQQCGSSFPTTTAISRPACGRSRSIRRSREDHDRRSRPQPQRREQPLTLDSPLRVEQPRRTSTT
jgi:cell division protein FtsB